jgi:hypothetical protein
MGTTLPLPKKNKINLFLARNKFLHESEKGKGRNTKN